MKTANFFYTLFLFALIFILPSCHRKLVPTSSSPARSNSNSNDEGSSITNMQDGILFYVNKHRTAIGLPELKMLNIASVEAAKHSANMAARRTPFGHTGFESRVAAISKSIGTVSAAAENVADGQLTAKEVVDGWLASAGHKKNIEGNYTLTGIGLAKDAGGNIFFTQIFLHK